MNNPDDEVGGHVAREAQKVSESAQHLERSAGAVQHSATRQELSADRRTVLAADRTVLAAERTYAAWVRTGLGALASGIGARALLKGLLPMWLGDLTASVLIVFSAFCFGAAVWRELWPGTAPQEPTVRRLSAPLLIALNGFLGLVSLAALVAVWMRRG